VPSDGPGSLNTPVLEGIPWYEHVPDACYRCAPAAGSAGLSNYIAILAQVCAKFRIEGCSGCATVLGMRHDALRPREREWRKR
jgi:hypothetical protein